MVTERFTVRLSIPLKSGARAEADIKLGEQGDTLSLQQAQEVQKALKTAASMGEVEMYVNVISTKVNDNWKPE